MTLGTPATPRYPECKSTRIGRLQCPPRVLLANMHPVSWVDFTPFTNMAGTESLMPDGVYSTMVG